MTHPVDLTDRAAFAFWSQDMVRFADLDRVGHVNNVAFATYCETGRVAFLEALAPGSTAGTGIGWTIVRLVIDFRAQAHYPGTVEIGTRVLKIGRSSATLGQGVFNDGRCSATSEAVCVWTDVGNGRSLALPEEVRAALERHLG